MSEATQSSLIPASSRILCNRPRLARAVVDLRLPVSGQVSVTSRISLGGTKLAFNNPASSNWQSHFKVNLQARDQDLQQAQGSLLSRTSPRPRPSGARSLLHAPG